MKCPKNKAWPHAELVPPTASAFDPLATFGAHVFARLAQHLPRPQSTLAADAQGAGCRRVASGGVMLVVGKEVVGKLTLGGQTQTEMV